MDNISDVVEHVLGFSGVSANDDEYIVRPDEMVDFSSI